MATLDRPQTNGAVEKLAEELHQLEREENALAERTDGVEWKQWVAIALSTFALGVALFAAVIALTNDDDNGTQTPAPAPQPTAGMPGGMHDGSGGGAAAAARTVSVELGEMYVKPSMRSISAGKVTFTAQNMGKLEHELMVEPAPIKFDAPGKPTEDAATGMIEDMGPGGHGKMSMRLKPGKYVLFCNVPGHYAAGQRTTFTVTES